MSSIVTARELRDRLSGPEWETEQEHDAERLLVELESALAARLSTFISPGAARTERCPVSESGMIITNYPVFDVVDVDGAVAVTDADGRCVLPPGWALVDHWVRRSGMLAVSTFPSPAMYDTSWMFTGRSGDLAGMLGGISALGGVDGPGTVAHVSVTYRPGWGADEGLRSAIITKATAVMINQHDNTITARALEGNRPAPATQDWTDSEITGLSSYRGMPGPMTTRW